MGAILSFIFDRLTDPLGLPVSALWEYVILLVIGSIAYAITFSFIGDMYDSGSISSSSAGSVCHWLIRFFVFVVVWAITYGVIALVKWITVHWVIVVSVLGGILLIAGIIAVIVIFNKKEKCYESIKKQRY